MRVRIARYLAIAVPVLLAAPVSLTGCGGGETGVGVGYVPYDEEFGEGFWGEEGPFGLGDEDEGGFDEDAYRGGAGRRPSGRPAVTSSTGEATGSIALAGSAPVRYREVRSGDGPAARVGDTVDISYTIRSSRGELLAGSEQRGRALRVTIGQNRALAGPDRGLVGLKAGGVRRFWLPPETVAGSGIGKALGGISPGGELVADVKLLALRPAARKPE